MFLSRIDRHPPKASRGVSVRPARLTVSGLVMDQKRAIAALGARPGQPLRPVSVAPQVQPEGLPAGAIAEWLVVNLRRLLSIPRSSAMPTSSLSAA